jgi:adenine phosphoribosyltransferase
MDNAEIIKKEIRTIPDFPVEGIMFRDVTTLMKNGKAFKLSCETLADKMNEFPGCDFIAGIESRGFIYGSIIAEKSGKGFIPIRKPGKLPASILSVEYQLEYGSDRIEVHQDAIIKNKRYLVVDDLLATGGTAEAACKLIEKGNGIVVGCLFLVELPDLKGREKLTGRKVVSIVTFEGE